MSKSTNVALSALLGAVALSALVSAPVQAADAPKMEKCYGVAKAGKNDCGNGAHSCSGHSTKDGAANEWVHVPAGLCAKLAGGSTTPPAM